MKKKIFLKVILILSLIILTWFIYSKYFKKKESLLSKPLQPAINLKEEIFYNSNIIKDINYTSRDLKGNEYILIAKEGEIDLDNSDIIFLTDVTAYIKLVKNSELIVITSNYGKYNTINYDTIFSKNVKIDYVDNIITGDYLDFSMMKNLLIISRNVVYKNLENTMKADVLELNTTTKDTKIFMYNSNEQVNVTNIK
ncbi:LPS export ABC transporter periplasmic protein LptC [Candidatus Pelagibacter sp.]|jgi:hypothetical protein|nr:LPS export ABC transporter periplasmic protein LptC [Candidatus Pelagibacter sp.]